MVYLEGIFYGSADIMQQLPTEYARFRAIDADFVSIMRKVSAKPNILDVIGFEGLHRSLERVSELLSKVQRALGEYLERQRVRFPRFYFVGDEDLLELIGSSAGAIQRHVSKMFAGISSWL